MLYFGIIVFGGCGALLRYLLSKASIHLGLTGIPFATLFANLIGCCLMGYLSWQFANKWVVSPAWQAVVLSGFLGGFTTFSAFSIESIRLLEDQALDKALLYILLSVAGSLCACFVGIWVAKNS